MKSIIAYSSLLVVLFSCNKKEPAYSTYTPSEIVQEHSAKNEIASNSPGLMLINASDCAGCHHQNNKMIGPSYIEIKAKYTEKDTEQLAKKIIDGGSGIWGKVPMQPHPQLTNEEAKQMVEYILSL